MSSDNGRSEPDFSGWDPIITAAVEVAERFPERYRESIFQTLVASGGAATPVTPTPRLRHGDGKPQVTDRGGGLARAAEEAGVSPADLERIVHVGEDGQLELLSEVSGASTAEKANRASAAYVFLREHASGERDVDIEELRILCQAKKAYDAPNFTRNFRAHGLLLEIGKRGSSNKKYRLSPAGQEVAKEVIRELVDA